MSFVLSSRSRRNLVGVHPDLIRIVERAAQLSPVQFVVAEGIRSAARQKEVVAAGASRTMRSRHLTGHAVDLGAIVGGKYSNVWALYQKIRIAMDAAAAEFGHNLRWGGDWDDDGDESDEHGLRDGAHFELPRADYPD